MKDKIRFNTFICSIHPNKNYVVKFKNDMKQVDHQTGVLKLKEQDYLLYFDFNSFYPSFIQGEKPSSKFERCFDLVYETLTRKMGILFEMRS